jgi:hypothetical protein
LNGALKIISLDLPLGRRLRKRFSMPHRKRWGIENLFRKVEGDLPKNKPVQQPSPRRVINRLQRNQEDILRFRSFRNS